MARTMARPRPVPPRVPARSPRAKRSKARRPPGGGPAPHRSPAAPRPPPPLRLLRTTSPSPWRRALSTRLPRPGGCAARRPPRAGRRRPPRGWRGRVHAPGRRSGARCRWSCAADTLSSRTARSPSPLRATDEQVVGQLRQRVALLQCGHEGLAHLGIVRPPLGAFQLRLDHRQGAQLVAGVGHEAPLALEGPAQALEHLVQRLAGLRTSSRAGASGSSSSCRRARSRLRVGASHPPGAARRRPRGSPATTRAPPRSAPRRQTKATRPASVSSRSSSDWPTATTDPPAGVGGPEQNARSALDAGHAALHRSLAAAAASASSSGVRTGSRAPPDASMTLPSPGSSTWAKPSSASPGAPAAASPDAAAAARVCRPALMLSLRSSSRRTSTNSPAAANTTSHGGCEGSRQAHADRRAAHPPPSRRSL